jgi:hypothetical protein
MTTSRKKKTSKPQKQQRKVYVLGNIMFVPDYYEDHKFRAPGGAVYTEKHLFDRNAMVQYYPLWDRTDLDSV